MQPDPALIEKQKVEQMMKSQRLDQLRVYCFIANNIRNEKMMI